jgi:diguanylate cyclase (GGDEF)-like protein
MHPAADTSDQWLVERIKGLTLDRQTDAVFIVNTARHLLYLNRAARSLFACPERGAVPDLPALLSGLRDQNPIAEVIESALSGRQINKPLALRTAERERSGIVHATPVIRHGACSHAVVSFHDETRFNRLQRRLTQDEFLDRVTGLYNRKTLEIMSGLELEKVERDPAHLRLAVLMVQIRNLDHFRAVYDEQTINHILEHVGSTIRKSMRNNDIIFRYDENRILALVTVFGWKSDLLIMAQRIENNVAIPFHPRETDIHLRAEIGICVYPEDGTDMPTLTANCIAALNQTRELDVSMVMFNQDAHLLARERLEIRSGLSTAVREGQLELYYMPIVDRDRRVRGVEALLRWNHPERGVLTPDAFLPIAIHSRIISGISRWVMYRVQEDYRNWFAASDIFITFNLSAKDFADKFLIEGIDSSMAGGVKSSRLKIEITESELMDDFELCSTMLEQLRQRGIGIFIDDFGVGQSSLAYVHDIPAECVKVDHSFMMRIDGPGREYDFLEAVVRLCKVLDRQVLLEGVETERQFELFRGCSADLFQGFLFGRPMPAAEVSRHCLV